MKHIIETHCNEETILQFAQGWGWTYSGSGLPWTALRGRPVLDRGPSPGPSAES